MVRILRTGSLRTDRMVASVVVLPLPVGPVIDDHAVRQLQQPPQRGIVAR